MVVVVEVEVVTVSPRDTPSQCPTLLSSSPDSERGGETADLEIFVKKRKYFTFLISDGGSDLSRKLLEKRFLQSILMNHFRPTKKTCGIENYSIGCKL